ncbi:MAG TPA: hypothetical protein VMF66_08220 [Candidatus Acidoferrum sp.]|nr:hypothetical protein [Candidatus Acidoferrum sp.]
MIYASQEQYEERTRARFHNAFAEIKWWEDRVASGLITPADAEGYLGIEREIVRATRIVLGRS